MLLAAAPLRAQSGRNRPEPLPSPSPGVQRPRRATASDEAPPGQPATSTAPSRTGNVPQPQGTPPPADKTSPPDAATVIDDDEVYKVDSTLVPVSAIVTDTAGRAVTDLTVNDFELRIDGQPKPISDISHAETPVRLALLFDNSSSVRPTRELEKHAAINFFRKVIRPVDQAAIFSISTVPTLDQPLTNDTAKLVRTIERFGDVEGSTALFDTVVMAADYLRPQPGRKVMIIISDGVETTSNLQDFGEMVRRVLASDCQVFVIQTGLSENANLRDLIAERRMQDLTSYTGGFVHAPKVASDLEAAFAQIAADLSQQYVLSYYPNDDGRDSRFRVISLRVKSRPNARVRARRGYYPRRRDNLSALPQNYVDADASRAGAIRDPVVTMSPRSPAREVASSTSMTRPVNSAIASAANAPARASKNLDPDEGGAPADGGAATRSALRLGAFNPKQKPADDPPEAKPEAKSETPPAASDSRRQPSPPTLRPENNSNPTKAADAPVVTSNAQAEAQPEAVRLEESSVKSSPAQVESARAGSPEPPKSLIVSGGVLNSRAQSLPVPAYPAAARRLQVSGTVVVEVTVDESGKVIEARAASGPAPLREAAVGSARQARFPVTLVSGQPARMTGVINYTFRL